MWGNCQVMLPGWHIISPSNTSRTHFNCLLAAIILYGQWANLEGQGQVGLFLFDFNSFYFYFLFVILFDIFDVFYWLIMPCYDCNSVAKTL